MFEGFDEALLAKGRDGDKQLHVRFYTDAALDDAETKKAGRPIYRDVPWIEILIPGDATNIVRRVAHINDTHPMSDNHRFPEHWAAFQRNQSQEGVVGTPIDQLPGITKSQAAELKFLNIRTVENLASLPDSLGQKVMGAHSLKQRAQAWLEAAAGNAPMEKMRDELAKRDAEIAEMKAQLASIVAAQEPVKRGPGRPPKNAES